MSPTYHLSASFNNRLLALHLVMWVTSEVVVSGSEMPDLFSDLVLSPHKRKNYYFGFSDSKHKIGGKYIFFGKIGKLRKMSKHARVPEKGSRTKFELTMISNYEVLNRKKIITILDNIRPAPPVKTHITEQKSSNHSC